ncbi:hypothetical protein BHE74_00023193 [Ensete ventricosum]|nr:hypothetical protein BHE74_00023193 [Ensete ventricosum]
MASELCSLVLGRGLSCTKPRAHPPIARLLRPSLRVSGKMRNRNLRSALPAYFSAHYVRIIVSVGLLDARIKVAAQEKINVELLEGQLEKLKNEMSSRNSVEEGKHSILDWESPVILELNDLRKENELLKDDIQTLKLKLADISETEEHVSLLGKEQSALKSSFMELQSQFAKAQDDVSKLDSLQYECKALSIKVENLQELFDNARQTLDHPSLDLQHHELQKKVDKLEASVTETNMSKFPSEKFHHYDEILQQKIDILEKRLQESDGTAPASELASCGLNVHHLNRPDRMQDNSAHDKVNPVKGGRGLHETLKSSSKKFVGVLNGIDTDAWNPSTDNYIRVQYSADDLQGKAGNKDALRKLLKLSSSKVTQPLITFILQREFEDIANQFQSHSHVRLLLKYDDALSHLIFAASDMFVIPSMFEPCGLTQRDMRLDFSWNSSATQYEELYQRSVARARTTTRVGQGGRRRGRRGGRAGNEFLSAGCMDSDGIECVSSIDGMMDVETSLPHHTSSKSHGGGGGGGGPHPGVAPATSVHELLECPVYLTNFISFLRIIYISGSIVFNCFGHYFCLHFEAFQLGMAPVYMAFLRFMGDENEARSFSYSLEVGANGRKLTWEGTPRSIRDGHRKVRDSHDGLIIQRNMALFFSGGDRKELKLRVTGRIWKEQQGNETGVCMPNLCS